MEWWLALIAIFGGLLVLLAIGLPVAFAFILVNIVGVFVWWGGESGLEVLIITMFSAVSKFVFLPFLFFILMGEILFRSEIAFRAIYAVDMWLGRLPGRLSLVAVGSGVVLATLTSSSMASAALLGSVLVPEMEKKGYGKTMSLGPILGSGGLATLIPPSGQAVFLASIAEVSVAKLLMAGIIPALVMASIFGIYIVVRSWLQPSLAPPYEQKSTLNLYNKFIITIRYLLPVVFIIFLVTGLIVLGIATPTEAAAVGCFGSLVISAVYRGLSWRVLRESVLEGTKLSIMVLMILAGAIAFSQVIAYSGASQGLLNLVVGLSVPSYAIIIILMLIGLFLGCFMDALSICMIVIPVAMPIIHALDFNPLLFSVLLLVNVEIGVITPPFGAVLFAMQGVAPANTTAGDIYRAAVPYVIMSSAVILLMLFVPQIALWLPGIMRR